MKTAKTKGAARRQDRYLELIQDFPLRSLRSEQDVEQAMQALQPLVLREHDSLDEGERNYVDALTILIQEYQHKHPLNLPQRTPVARLKFLMKEAGMNVSELGKVLGSQPAASMILSGKRQPSKAHIRKLADRFKISADYFL